MKKYLLSIILFSQASFAQNLNTCSARPDSKRYIDYDFQSAFPKKVTFSCIYKCHSKDLSKEIKAIRSVTINSLQAEGTQLVCQGVIVKKGRWGYEFDKVEPFFIHDTKMKEIKKWALEQSIDLDAQGSQKLMENLISTLSEVSRSYSIAGSNDSVYSRDFKEASIILDKISKELPTNTETLDIYIDKINNDISGDNYAETLILNLIKSYASWRLVN